MGAQNNKPSDQPTTRVRKDLLLKALEKHLGVVKTACDEVGVLRQTYYKWLKADKRFRERVQDIKEVGLDYAESKLLQKIKAGNLTAIIFYLKTQGKVRGYIERTDVTSGDKPIEAVKVTIVRAKKQEE